MDDGEYILDQLASLFIEQIEREDDIDCENEDADGEVVYGFN